MEDQIATALYQGEGDVPWDYVLFQYRRKMGMTWQEVKATPRWRINLDMQYLAVEATTPKGNQADA